MAFRDKERDCGFAALARFPDKPLFGGTFWVVGQLAGQTPIWPVMGPIIPLAIEPGCGLIQKGISIVQRSLRPSALIPNGLRVESAVLEGTAAVITVRAHAKTSACPSCGVQARRVHSRYRRTLLDLPLGGRPVHPVVSARRFRCDVSSCARRIFAERFGGGALEPWARRTARVDDLVHHLGLALGGRPAASFAARLMLRVSNDTLLRLVRRRGCPPLAAPRIIGIDDWAWRRNQRYGTLICDLERRRTIGLLPDREAATA